MVVFCRRLRLPRKKLCRCVIQQQQEQQQQQREQPPPAFPTIWLLAGWVAAAAAIGTRRVGTKVVALDRSNRHAHLSEPPWLHGACQIVRRRCASVARRPEVHTPERAADPFDSQTTLHVTQEEGERWGEKGVRLVAAAAAVVVDRSNRLGARSEGRNCSIQPRQVSAFMSPRALLRVHQNFIVSTYVYSMKPTDPHDDQRHPVHDVKS